MRNGGCGDDCGMPIETPTRGRLREELHHLHEIEERGEEAETPAIALGEVILFLLPIIGIILLGSFLAYYLA